MESSFLRLVSPMRIVHFVPAERSRGEPVLQALGAKYRLDVNDICNLRQLIGWVNCGERQGVPVKGRGRSGNWQLLEAVRYLKHDEGSEIVPIIGTNEHIFKTVVLPHPCMNFERGSLNNLLAGSKLHISKWRLLQQQPPQVAFVAEGVNLVITVNASRAAQEEPTVSVWQSLVPASLPNGLDRSEVVPNTPPNSAVPAFAPAVAPRVACSISPAVATPAVALAVAPAARRLAHERERERVVIGAASDLCIAYERAELEQHALAIWLDATDADEWKPGKGKAWQAWLAKLRGKEDADCAICGELLWKGEWEGCMRTGCVVRLHEDCIAARARFCDARICQHLPACKLGLCLCKPMPCCPLCRFILDRKYTRSVMCNPGKCSLRLGHNGQHEQEAVTGSRRSFSLAENVRRQTESGRHE